MKKILMFLAFTCLVFACRKNEDMLTTNSTHTNATKLVKIAGHDSADYYYAYAGDRVSEVYTTTIPDDTGNLFHYAHIDYMNDNYIIVTSPQDPFFYTEYYLTDLKLPLKIIEHYDSLNVETTNFFYRPGTNLLDSVDDDVPFYENYSSHQTFEYDGGDILKISEVKSFYGGSLVLYHDFNYNYDKTMPNIFRDTDSLLYIFRNPFGTQNELVSWADISASTGVYPRIFSSSTYTANIHNVNGAFFSVDSLSYILNADGKISSEIFENNYSLNYFYQ